MVCISENKVQELKKRVNNIQILSGTNGILEICNIPKIDVFVNALDGSVRTASDIYNNEE